MNICKNNVQHFSNQNQTCKNIATLLLLAIFAVYSLPINSAPIPNKLLAGSRSAHATTSTVSDFVNLHLKNTTKLYVINALVEVSSDVDLDILRHELLSSDCPLVAKHFKNDDTPFDSGLENKPHYKLWLNYIIPKFIYENTASYVVGTNQNTLVMCDEAEFQSLCVINWNVVVGSDYQNNVGAEALTG